jgi:hypothetical protein
VSPVSHRDSLGRGHVTGSLFGHVQAAFIGAYVRIMPACGHRSSCHYQRSALPTLADYAGGMAKTHLRKPDGRNSKTVADDASRRTTGPSCRKMEASMSDPLFVETSQGWINMALVTHVSVHGD